MEGQPPNKKVRYSDDHLGAGVVGAVNGGMAGPTGLEYPKMRVAELRAELKKRGLKCSGNKPELIERLENDDNPIEFYDMATDGKEKWLMVWMRIMMNLNHDSLFYSVFQGAVHQLLNPLMQASSVVVHSGHAFNDMLENSMKGKGKDCWGDITEKQLELGQMYAAAYNNEFSIEDEMEDDSVVEEDGEKEEINLNKIGGFKLAAIKMGSFFPKAFYPQQFRVKANVKKQQLEIYLFRYTPKRNLPKLLSKFGARPSKQLAEFIIKECNRFEVSRWFRMVIPFNSITALHLYHNTPDESNMMIGTESMGFLAFDLSATPSFQTRRVSAQTSLQNEWRDRTDFTKNKVASKFSDGRRIYLFGEHTDLAVLVTMLALSKPDIPVQELLDRGIVDVGNTNYSLHSDTLVELSAGSLSVPPGGASRSATVPRPNFADLRQPLSRDVIIFLAENKFLDLSMADDKTRKMITRYFKEKQGEDDEEDEEDEDEEEEEDEDELGRVLYKHIVSGTNSCFIDFVARNHENVEAIKKMLSTTIDLSKATGMEDLGGNNGNGNGSTTRTVLEYMRSLIDPTLAAKFPGTDQMYFSFCYGHFVDKQHGSHCEVCGHCADWRSWHCWNCNRCTDSNAIGSNVPVCEHCGNSSMTGPKFKTRPSSWRLSSVFTSGEFENGEMEEDDEAVRELCISESDDEEPSWPDLELKTDDVNKMMLMSLILGGRGTTQHSASGNPLGDTFSLNTQNAQQEPECVIQ